MANKSLNSQIITKNDTATNWANPSLVLGKGELALDTDNNVCKIDDGVHTWGLLPCSRKQIIL